MNEQANSTLAPELLGANVSRVPCSHRDNPIRRSTQRNSYDDLRLIAISLEDFLNRKYPIPDGGYLILRSRYKEYQFLDEVRLMVASNNLPERHKRALATLLINSDDEAGFYIQYRKSVLSFEDGGMDDTCLLIGFDGKNFDAAAAMRQVGERMKLLEDDNTLENLSPETLAYF